MKRWPGRDAWFVMAMGFPLALYVLLIVSLLAVDAARTHVDVIARALQDPDILFSIKLSIFTCTISALMSVVIAVPIGYLMSRSRFPGRLLVDVCLDIPMVLPPLVIGLSLLILFQTSAGRFVEQQFGVSLTNSYPKAQKGIKLGTCPRPI